jgi:hypothetical protein
VSADVIRAQKDYLDHVLNKVEKLAKKKSAPEAIENLITPLLNQFKFPASQLQKYSRRLRYGLHRYYARHYRSSGSGSGEE